MIKQERIKYMIDLSTRKGTDSHRIVSMMDEHVDEIKELFDSKDEHFAVETGDLILLASQLLMMEGYNIDNIMNKCYERFDRKFGVVKV